MCNCEMCRNYKHHAVCGMCMCLGAADRCFWYRALVAHFKQVNYYGFLERTDVVKFCIFRYELAFVIGVTMDRWHHSQSDAVCRINECGLVMALERFWRKEGGSLVVFVCATYL